MCGIFALLNNNNDFSDDFIKKQFKKGKNRGPEHSIIVTNLKSILGFHRLAINGLNQISNQPIVNGDISLICNGEIYNYKQLYTDMNINPETQSDCEVIIHLYKRYGIEQTLQMLDGVFAFVLLDTTIRNNDLESKMYVARDPFGVRPLYILQNTKNVIGFASELKVLSDFKDNDDTTLKQFTPGTYSKYVLSNKIKSQWQSVKENTKYFIPHFPKTILNRNNDHFDTIMYNIKNLLTDSVYKRCITTERPIACLLSGGLDSSLIAALVNQYNNLNSNNVLETYSIGLQNSEDLKYARIVANYLKTKHTEIIVTEKEMFDAIPEVIKAIESYDTTTIRASIGNYLIGKYISANSEAKVIFNGDGSDEICGGYLYMNKCPDSIEFDKETRRLLEDIHLFDVLRSDKCISSHGLEPRTPFLDKTFVNYYLSISVNQRNHTLIQNRCEKYLLRKSFSNDLNNLHNERSLLPDEILWRRKEAFSDGVSCQGRSLYKILQDMISIKLNLENPDKSFESNLETEKYYYKTIFDSYYPNSDNIIPYFWMPKYINSSDPSARTLSIYTTNTNSEEYNKNLEI
jgi:asparagine synthase (glutamine-hydrolysing)